MQRAILRTTVLAIALLAMASLAVADVPQLINYQGRLTDAVGDPVTDGSYLIKFTIYGSPDGDDTLWSSDYREIEVTDGLFSYQLGDTVALPDNLFSTGIERYLGIKVQADPEISPRTRLITVPYAYHALRADTADFAWSGPGGGNWSVTDSVLYTNNYWGLARGGAGNVIYGDSAHTMVNLGVACTTGTSGGYNFYSTVSGGSFNTASGNASTVAGGVDNTASNSASTVAGGISNTASGSLSVVGGGHYNQAVGLLSVVSGGGGIVAGGNSANGDYSAIGGGVDNTANGEVSTVGGGGGNTASGSLSTVPGGEANTAGGKYAFAAGRRAKANHHGTFVWADSTDEDFVSTGDNQFLIRAEGNVGINEPDPAYDLDVNEDVRVQDDLTVNHDVNVNGRVNIVDPGDLIWTGYRLQVSGRAYFDSSIVTDFDFDTTFSISVGQADTVSHGLGGNEDMYIVIVDGKSNHASGWHQANFGTCPIEFGLTPKWIGLEWFGLTDQRIIVYRGNADTQGNERDWDQVRIRIIANQ